MKAGAISHRSRYRDHRTFHKTTHNTCQCTLHSCYCNHAVSLLDGIQSGKESVHTTNSHIIDPLHMCAEILCCLGSLLRNRNICCSGCTHCHFSDMLLLFFNLQNSGNRIVDHIGKNLFYQFILIFRRPCSKDFSIFLIKLLIDIQKVFVCFSRTVNYLCKTGPRFSGSIQFRIIHFLISLFFQKALCMLHRELAIFYLFKNLL